MKTTPDRTRPEPAAPEPRRSRPVIGHVVTRYLRGGSERRVRDIVGALPEAEHHLVIGSGSDVELARREVDAASLTVVPALVRRPHPWLDAVALRHLVRLIRAGGFDAVVTHQSKAGILGRTAARICSVPAVHSLSMAAFGEGYPRWQSVLFRTLESRLARATTAYAVVGSDLARRYERVGVPAEKLHLVRSGVALPAPWGSPPSRVEVCRALGLPADRPLILCLGSLEPRKNVLRLPELLARVHAAGGEPPPFLVVAGEGPLAQSLARAIGDAGLGEDARLLGYLPGPLPLVGTADVLVLLSSAEGVPQVLVQAAAMGTPFVAYEVDGVRELLELGAEGVAVPAEDLDAAAAAISATLRRGRSRTAASIDLSSWSEASIAEGYRRVLAPVLVAEASTAPFLEAAPRLSEG